MNTENIIKVSQFAKSYKNKFGKKGVTPAYIYKVWYKAQDNKTTDQLSWRIIDIAGFKYVETSI